MLGDAPGHRHLGKRELRIAVVIILHRERPELYHGILAYIIAGSRRGVAV
jgi:hypothetical protein